MVKTVHPVTFDKQFNPKVDKDFRGRPIDEDIPEGEATVVLVPVAVVPEYTEDEGFGMADNDGFPGDNDEPELTGKP